MMMVMTTTMMRYQCSFYGRQQIKLNKKPESEESKFSAVEQTPDKFETFVLEGIGGSLGHAVAREKTRELLKRVKY